jgi:queuine tRNA-ribosyltransferase catalytic subunit
LPEGKPRYVMGIGYPEDIVVAVALGADMFDCVWPTRTARFGNAITHNGVLNLRHSSFARDFSPIESTCRCVVCKSTDDDGLGVTRAYVHHLAAKETVGAHLVTLHNVHFMLALMKEIRSAISEQRYPSFVKEFLTSYFGEAGVPGWAREALAKVDIEV